MNTSIDDASFLDYEYQKDLWALIGQGHSTRSAKRTLAKQRKKKAHPLRGNRARNN